MRARFQTRRLVAAAAVALVLGAFALAAVLAARGRAGSAPGGGGATPVAARRPNVVLISLDTLRPDHLGCYGYGRPTSPFLDEFARSSVRFERAWSQAPWTLPSHMSLFTSMLPSHNGVDFEHKVLPESVPTLAQLLHDSGYHTGAIVNNGQMRAHWGFGRGFDQWSEFAALAPEGNCDNITSQAMAWLSSAPPEPYFLFVHYYDAHDPYDPPEPYRGALGATGWGREGELAAWRARYPGRSVDPAILRSMIAAYDGEIAWLDAAIGRLLTVIPPDAIVVIFSDHGEAFEEHDWLRHGHTLYEEETRVLLMMRVPGRPARVSHEPVMLLDVAPTILSLCGVTAPPNYQGADLSGVLDGRSLPARPIPSETKTFTGGRVARSITLPPWKLIYVPTEALWELYRLPDEQTNLLDREPQVVETMAGPLREWVEEEDFWTIHTHGEGEYEVVIQAPPEAGGLLSAVLQLGVDHPPEKEQMSIEDLREVHWRTRPGEGISSLYVETAPRGLPLRIDVLHNGQRAPGAVHLGTGGERPAELPVQLTLESAAESPVIQRRFEAPEAGVYLRRHKGKNSAGRASEAKPMDKELVEQLRSLGYLQ